LLTFLTVGSSSTCCTGGSGGSVASVYTGNTLVADLTLLAGNALVTAFALLSSWASGTFGTFIAFSAHLAL